MHTAGLLSILSLLSLTIFLPLTFSELAIDFHIFGLIFILILYVIFLHIFPFFPFFIFSSLFFLLLIFFPLQFGIYILLVVSHDILACTGNYQRKVKQKCNNKLLALKFHTYFYDSIFQILFGFTRQILYYYLGHLFMYCTFLYATLCFWNHFSSVVRFLEYFDIMVCTGHFMFYRDNCKNYIQLKPTGTFLSIPCFMSFGHPKSHSNCGNPQISGIKQHLYK